MSGDTRMFQVAMLIGDLADALGVEELSGDTLSKILVECSPVIVRHVLKEV